MANIKKGVLRADSDPANRPEGSEASHPLTQQEQASGSLSEVSANISDLMAPEKRKTLLFEPSAISQSMIDFYILKGYFPEGVCRPPGQQVISVPEFGEVVVFKDFFTAGVPSEGSDSAEATRALQREDAPLYPEWYCCFVQVLVDCKDVWGCGVR